MDQKKKIEDLDFLINILSSNGPSVEEFINKDKVIPYLKDLKGFLTFIDKYGEPNLDAMNVVRLALSDLPKTAGEYNKALWFAYQAGINAKGEMKNEQTK